MKRGGPLKRRVGLKRSPMPPRKTWMNRVNPKTAKIRRQARDPRARYVAEHFTCQVCHKRKATECHEIVTRANNRESVLYRACYLATCWTCHREELSDYSRYPLTRQLAVKLVNDPAHFDLSVVNRLRGRSATAITLEDVAQHLTLKGA